jgi:hypothetical protein
VSITLSPRDALALLLAVLILVTAGSIVTAEFAGGDESLDPDDEYVELEDGTVLWPYHSHTPDYSTRTLPISVVVYGDAAATQRLLMEGGLGEWEEIPEDREDIDPAEAPSTVDRTRAGWDPAGGAVRYVYLEPAGGGAPRWTDADYQLHTGDYLGSRHHIRAYVDPSDGDWTVMQTHREHWDWFRLRHTVHSVDDSQGYVEEQFLDRRYVENLRREHFGNDVGSDTDGWVTVVELEDWLSLAAAALIVGSITATDRRFGLSTEYGDTTARAALLAGVVVALYLFVRLGAITVERTFPGLDPKLIVAVFHPVLVVGVPVATYLTARVLDEILAFATASLAFLVALFLDYTLLGVGSLPLDTFVYHVGVAAAIGFVAAGASRRARRPDTERGHVRTGVLLWIVVGALPLLRFVHPV